MNRQARILRKKSIRAKVKGNQQRPRLNVFRSSKHIYASLINDQEGKTMTAASEKDIQSASELSKTEKAYLVGKAIGQKATKKGFKKVVFDRAASYITVE